MAGRAASFVVAVAVALAGCDVAVAADVGGPFMLRAAHSGKCLDVTGGPAATGSGVAIQQYDCLGADQTNQQWYFTPTGDGATYFVKAGNSGKCLDVIGGVGATANGVRIQQFACLGYGQSNQRWSVVPAGDSTTYYVKAANSGKCLDVAGGQTATGNGAPLQQYDCLSYPQSNQRFFFTRPDGIPVVPDLDGDGWDLQHDCNDASASLHPGAPDPAGDGIDQNCDGADAAPVTTQSPATAEDTAHVLLVRVVNLWTVQGRTTRVRELAVRGAPQGTRVTVYCRGRGCPFSRQARRTRHGGVDLHRPFGHRSLRAQTTIRLRLSMPKLGSYEVRFRLRARKLPRRTDLCPATGSAKLQRCR